MKEKIITEFRYKKQETQLEDRATKSLQKIFDNTGLKVTDGYLSKTGSVERKDGVYEFVEMRFYMKKMVG